jgi:hypothetical protein
MLFPLGFLGTFLLNNYLKETYISRRSELEKNIESLIDKSVDLGDYSGIRLLGISLGKSKIVDKENISSVIKAKNVYLGIMPIKSFLNQKLILRIKPELTEINVNRDFFKMEKPYIKSQSTKRLKLNYDLIFNLNKYSTLKFNDIELGTKVKGNIIYKSNTKQLFANL